MFWCRSVLGTQANVINCKRGSKASSTCLKSVLASIVPKTKIIDLTWKIFGRPLQGLPIKMFQYEICPFCNKIKAVLDYCKVPYDTVEVKEKERERETKRGREREGARARARREREDLISKIIFDVIQHF